MIGALQLPLWLAVAAPIVGVSPLSTDSAGPAASAALQASVSLAARRTVVEAAESGTVVFADFERLARRAAAAGIRCEAWHPDCAARIGAFGSLDFVLVPRLVGSTITITLVDCTDGRVVRTMSGELSESARERDATVANLARAALGTAPPPLATAAPPVAAATSADHAAPTSAIDASARPSTDRLLSRVGVGALVVGALFAVGAGVGAAVVAPTADRRAQTTAREYNDAVTAGRALLVVGAAGLVIGGAGAVAWLVDGEGAP